MPVIVGILWAVAGALFGVPYFYLSSANEFFFVHIFLIVPILTVLGAFLFLIERARHRHGLTPLFIVYLIWATSPIIMNGLSWVVRHTLSEKVGAFLFEGRFVPLWLPPALILVIAVIVGDLLRTHKRIERFKEANGEGAKPEKKE